MSTFIFLKNLESASGWAQKSFSTESAEHGITKLTSKSHQDHKLGISPPVLPENPNMLGVLKESLIGQAQ